MKLMPDTPKIDENYIRERAEQVTERDIQYVREHEEEIRNRFLGNGPLGRFVEEAFLTLAMLKDYATGAYRKLPYWAVGAIAFMLFYVANPVDLIPDFLIGVGQIDDVIVVTLCLLMVRQEIHEYKYWRENLRDTEQDQDEPINPNDFQEEDFE